MKILLEEGSPEDEKALREALRAGGLEFEMVRAGDAAAPARRLAAAEKMETLAAFAAAMAHDFNNILGAIEGYTSIMLPSLEDGSMKEDVGEIRKAGERGAELTRGLMMFSRKQKLALAEEDLCSITENLKPAIAARAGGGVRTELSLPAGTVPARCDRAAVESVILELASNAADAMPAGGTLSIEVVNAAYDRDALPGCRLARGRRAASIAITDTGEGMTAGTAERAFEPFFTTRVRGKGKGLGLARVYGIIIQHGGDIELTSAPGKGTSVRIWLPAGEQEPAARTPAAAAGAPYILMIEDDARLRNISMKALRACGFAVDGAAGLEEALALLSLRPSAYDVVFSDVVLPDGQAHKALHRFLAVSPGIEFVFTTGFLDTSALAEEVSATGYPLIEKPYPLERTARILGDIAKKRRGAA